jgi:hypothetical protein
MGPAMAHLLSLRNKMHLGANEYQTVQKIYRGWALLGILLVLALLFNLLLTFTTLQNATLFYLNAGAFLCMLSSLLIFFIFTFPVNQETKNWTKLTANWKQLRNQWEYSHATNAGLHLVALILLITSVLMN